MSERQQPARCAVGAPSGSVTSCGFPTNERRSARPISPCSPPSRRA